MPAQNRIPLLCPDRGTQQAVAGAASQVPELGSEPVLCKDLRELAAHLQDSSAVVAIVDIDPEPLAALAKLEPLTRRFKDTRFIVVCNEFKNEVLLEAMQVGARHCLARSSIAADLPAVLRRSLEDRPATGASGRMVTVLSARGGCGATTIAINFAEEARLASGDPALIVDLDRHYGSMGAYLGLGAKYGLRDLLSHKAHIDDHLVRSSAAHYSDGLDVLLGPASIDSTAGAELPLERLSQALSACRRAYSLTVVDAPRLPIDLAAELASASHLTLVVFELSVVDIRGARALLVALNDRRVPPSSILAVANRYRKRNPMLSLEDAEKALAGWSVVPVSNDYLNSLKSINLGQPLSQTAPRSDLRRDIQALASRMGALANGVAGKGEVAR